MTFYQTLQTIGNTLGIPVAYSHFKTGGMNTPAYPPYMVYMGNGQDNFEADNTHYYSQNRYRLEYYFTEKNEALEADLEEELLKAGFLYDKSEDTFIESEGVFVIYYQI